MADGSVIIDTALDDSSVKSGLGKLNSVAGQALGGVAKAAGAMAVAIGTAAAAGAVAIGKAVLSSYAEYEQLVGGVDTLFKGSSAQLQQYAANAYKTAGMSANDYMSTVTSFSASLISSLGGDTEKATSYADRAVTDMADNANKMGTSIESIQQTYQSLARGNYAMLDNLKLGYGGTKEEMERLLTDAEKLPEAMGKDFDINNFADVTEAIHLVQTEMGITGTTAKEAEGTISGSVATMGAAWQNFLTGLGDPDANISELAGNVATAFQNVVTNVTPVLDQLVKALPEAFKTLFPAIAGMLPTLITAATGLFMGALNAIVAILPTLIPVAVTAILTIVQGLIDNLPLILDAALQIIMALITGIIEMLPELAVAAIEIISQLALSISEQLPTLIPMMIDVILAIVQGLLENIDLLIDASIAIIVGLASGLIASIPKLVARLPEIITAIVNGIISLLGGIFRLGADLLSKLWDGISSWFGNLKENAGQIVTNILDKIASKWQDIKNKGKEIISKIWDGISGWFTTLKENAGKIVDKIKDGITGAVQRVKDIGTNIVEGIWDGISGSFKWIRDNIKEWVGNVLDFIKGLFGINSPSKLMRDEIGKFLPPGIAIGFELAMPQSIRDMKKSLGGMMGQMQTAVLGGQNNLRVSYATTGSNDNIPAVGDTYYYSQTVNTHDSMSPHELTQEFDAMKAREGWKIP